MKATTCQESGRRGGIAQAERARAGEIPITGAAVPQPPAPGAERLATRRPRRFHLSRVRTAAARRESVTVYVVITKDREPPARYRVTLRSALGETRPKMQSAAVLTPSNAQREAERLFGPLTWMSRDQAGLDG